MRKHELVYALNAGGVDPDALSRVDLEKMRLAGEHPVANFLPTVLGPVTIRPGSENLAPIPGNARTRQIRFLRAVDTSYILLMAAGEMRISLDGVVQQVPAVATTIASGSWSDVSTSPASATGGASLVFSPSTTHAARLRQTVTVAAPDQSISHVLRVVISKGPVLLRVGSTAGGQEILRDASLDTGTHKIAFTPGAGTIYVEVRAEDYVSRVVSQIQFESTLIGGAGDLVIPLPWTTDERVAALRTWQSIDVMFAGDGEQQQRRITHRGPLSWGIELYKTSVGPFTVGSPRISMTPGAQSGDTTMTASEAYFESGHVGALIELTQTGKTVPTIMNTVGQTSDYVTIVGITTGRNFTREGINFGFTGEIVLERSFEISDPTVWSVFQSYVDGAVASAVTTENDAQDNVVVHYRFRVVSRTAGSANMFLVYKSGIKTGIARITGYVSSTVVNVEIIDDFGGTSGTQDWRIGDWSDVRGWPRVPLIHDSRLHWFRKDEDFASAPDDYTNFDDEATGDSAPFTRSVGVGGQDGVLWAMSENRLLVGTAAFEAAIAASELDEPLTPTAYTVRKVSRRGCADLEAIEHDDGVFYVQRSGVKLYEMSVPDGSSRFKSNDITRLNPAAYQSGIVRMAMQQQPDARLYAVLHDGTVSVLTYERDDKVIAITTIEIEGGLVEDVCVLPESDQDDVYMVVNRDGTRYHERLAKENLQRNVSTCALLDGFKVITGPTNMITGGTHFAGELVQVWADGQKRENVILNGSGAATLTGTYNRIVYGKKFTAVFKSVKLAYASGLGTALGQTKIIKGVGVVLSDSCLDGIRVGRDADNLDPLPDIVNGAARVQNQLFEHYDADVFPINSDWDADARLYLTVDSADGPCTIQSVVLDVETRDGAQSG